MVKGIMCAECCYLDKTRKQYGNNGTGCFRYGCNAIIRDKFICGWIRTDNELKTMGCSNCNRIKVGTMFKLKSEEHVYTILYCGKVGNEYLLYNQNLKTFKLVKRTWFSEHIKRIQFCECNDTKMNTKADKIRFRKKLAKARKERYMREHGCNRN